MIRSADNACAIARLAEDALSFAVKKLETGCPHLINPRLIGSRCWRTTSVGKSMLAQPITNSRQCSEADRRARHTQSERHAGRADDYGHPAGLRRRRQPASMVMEKLPVWRRMSCMSEADNSPMRTMPLK